MSKSTKIFVLVAVVLAVGLIAIGNQKRHNDLLAQEAGQND